MPPFIKALSEACSRFLVLSALLGTLLIATQLTVAQDTPPVALPTPVTIPPAPLPADPPPVAPDYDPPSRPLPSSERIGVTVADQLSLTLEDAIVRALENNNDIDVSRQDRQIEQLQLKAARGVYDPLVFSEGYYESATSPTASVIGGGVNGSVTQTRFFGSGGVSGFSPRFGGNYSARLDTSRSTTSNTNALLNPQYPSILAFEYTQPLFRGLRIDNNRRTIEISKRNINISASQLRQRAIEVVSGVERAYWDLVFALRNLQVQIDSVRRAREQLESNQRLVDRGVLAPIELVAATAQITTLEQAVYGAQASVTVAENILKTLMLPDRSAPEWSRAITPVSPIDRETPSIGLAISLSEAFKNRPEIEQLNETAAINQIDQRFFKDQTRPQIDLVASYTSQGLAGALTERAIQNPQTPVPPNLVGGVGTSLGNLFQQDYPTYRVGITIGLPLGNNVAEANLGIARVQGERIANLQAQTGQTIEAEVRNALQQLRTAEATLAAARAARIAAEQLAESELRQFRAGTTTFYLVQQRENELTTARSRELQAQTDLNKAISNFYRAIGTTLAENRIDLK